MVLRTASVFIGLALAWTQPTPTLAEEAKSLSFQVQFPTEDGFTLHADVVSAANTSAPVAILLHMYRSDRNAWAPLVPILTAAGFTVVALDQRTHGASTRKGEEQLRVREIPRDRFGEVVRQGPLDVQAVRRFLEGRGFATDRIVLVGASYGCSVALLSAEKVDGVRAVAALSPGTAYFEVDVVDAASRFTEALLLVAAEDDPPAAASARTLAATHDGPEELIVYASGGHGTRLLSKRPELAHRLVTFLQEAVASDASGPSSGPG